MAGPDLFLNRMIRYKFFRWACLNLISHLPWIDIVTERHPQENHIELTGDVNDLVSGQGPNGVSDTHGAHERGTMPKRKGNVKEVWFVGSHSDM